VKHHASLNCVAGTRESHGMQGAGHRANARSQVGEEAEEDPQLRKGKFPGGGSSAGEEEGK